MKRALAVAALVWGFVAIAAAESMSSGTLEAIRLIAIQHHGRHKPFDSFARETLDQVTGALRWKGQDPVATALSIMAQPECWQAGPLIAIPFVPLREALGLDRQTTHVSYDELIASRALMRRLPPIVAKQQRDEKLTMLEQETMDAYERFVALSGLLEQRLDLVPPPQGSDAMSWQPILQPEGQPPAIRQRLRAQWTALVRALREGQAAPTAARELASALRAANPSAYPAAWRLRLEILYNHLAPFALARFLYALAALAFLLGLWSLPGVTAASQGPRPMRGDTPSTRTTRFAQAGGRLRPALRLGQGLFVAAFVVHGAGIASRVVLGGRPPVSNFFETMLWLPFVAVALAFVFGRIYRVAYFGLAAAILSSVTLLLADRLPLDSSISPVVAVLRSNLWLTIHVLTIVASYGALALATAMAHVYGVVLLARRGTQATLAALETFLYRAIQVGVVLLAGGIMLGAVWANASWGRYWGWDPKETWALITLLWFLAVLHGRFAGWLRGPALAVVTIGGFFLLLMTYYGVSFYLVGLHSYAGGHAKPIPPLLIGYLIAEATFMVAVALVARRRVRSS